MTLNHASISLGISFGILRSHLNHVLNLQKFENNKIQEISLQQINAFFSVREAAKKKPVFLEDLSQICFPTHPPQGFCEIWENER